MEGKEEKIEKAVEDVSGVEKALAQRDLERSVELKRGGVVNGKKYKKGQRVIVDRATMKELHKNKMV